MLTLQGRGVSKGFAFGRLKFYHQHKGSTVQRHSVQNAAAEIQRVEDAARRVSEDLEELYTRATDSLGEENAELFRIHQMLLEDPDFRDAIVQMIRDESVCGEYAVQQTGEAFAQAFRAMDDSYMQARSADIVDVTNHLLRALTGTDAENMDFGEPVILAADDLMPSETARMDASRVLAFVTAKGSATSHAAIFARTMGIPAIVSLGDALRPEMDGVEAAVDGDGGKLIIEPDGETAVILQDKEAAYRQMLEQAEKFRGKETRSADGRTLKLCANVGGMEDVKAAVRADAEGIGLLRSEFLYLQSSDYPAEETLFQAYRQALERMKGKQVIIRTLDIGADKQADYFHLAQEENPAMGLRAIRLCLSRPKLFRTQLRAIYRASAFGKAAIMFPMITSVDEVRRAKEIAASVREELSEEGIAFDSEVSIGIMIETPAAALLSDELAKECDFFSVGTNDLTQYTLALDRQNAEVAIFDDPQHRAVLRLIELAAKNAHAAGIWIGICGEMGADAALLPAFLRMGIDELSVAPGSVLPLRAKIAGLSAQ